MILHPNPTRKREGQREGKESSASAPKSSRRPERTISTSSLALRNSRAESGLPWPWISLSRDSIPGFSGAGHTCHCHAFEQFEFLWCSMHRQPFCLFYGGYYFTLPSIPLGLPQHFHPRGAVTWESGKSWGRQTPGCPLLLHLPRALGAF